MVPQKMLNIIVSKRHLWKDFWKDFCEDKIVNSLDPNPTGFANVRIYRSTISKPE